MSSTAKTGTTTPSPPSSAREGSWRGSSDALLDAFETLLQEGELSYTIKRHSGGKWSSEELLSSCQALLDDARDVVLSVESPGDSSAKRVKSWLKQTQPKQDATAKDRIAKANYILGQSRTLPGQSQRSSQAFERNIDNIFGEVEVECCDSAIGKSVTTTISGDGNSVITRPRSFDDLSDTDSYSSFESYGQFDPKEALVSDSEDDECFLKFETCSSGSSEEESEMMTDDRFSAIDTGNEGDVEETTTTDGGSNYSVFTTSAEELWQYNPSYGDTSPELSAFSPGLLTPPGLEMAQGSSDETLRALSALGSNSSVESTGCCPETIPSDNKLCDGHIHPPLCEIATAVTSPPANKQVDVPRGIQGVPQQPQGHPQPKTGVTVLSRTQPTSRDSVMRHSIQECTAAAATTGDVRMPEGVPQEAVADGKDGGGSDHGSDGGVVPQVLRSVSGTVPVEPSRCEQRASVGPPPQPSTPSGAPVVTAVAAPAATVPRHWSNTIANLPHADSVLDVLDHREDMADIFGGDTSTLKRKQDRDTVLFNEDFKTFVGAQEAEVISPNFTEEVFGHVRYSDGFEDDSVAYANVLVVNSTPAVMDPIETTSPTPTPLTPPSEEATRILRGRRPAPQPPASPTPPPTPVQSPSKTGPSFKVATSPVPLKSPVGTPKLVQKTSTSASTPGRNSPYSWVRLGPKRPAPLPPVFLPYKKAPAPPPPTSDSDTLKRKQHNKDTQHLNPFLRDEAQPSSVAHASPAQVFKEHSTRCSNETGTTMDQAHPDYSEMYGFKYKGDDVRNKKSNKNGTLKQSKEKHSDKENIYSQLGLSKDQYGEPIFGGDGSLVTKLGDEDFLVKTVTGEEFLVTSIGGDEYLVSSINVDKEESKKVAEDVSIIKNTDGIFSLKDKSPLKSSSKSRMNKDGMKSQRNDSRGHSSERKKGMHSNKSSREHSADSKRGVQSRKSSREHSADSKRVVQESKTNRGHSAKGAYSSISSSGVRGNVTEGRHSRSAVAAAAAPAPNTAAHAPTCSSATVDPASIRHDYTQLPPDNISPLDDKTYFTDKRNVDIPETLNYNKENSGNKSDSLKRKSDYVTTIYVQDIESPTGVKGVRNYGTVRATTVNTTNQDTIKDINKNDSETKVKSNLPNVCHNAAKDEQVVTANELSRSVGSAGTSVCSSSSETTVVGRGVPPCDSSECQVSPPAAAASSSLAAEALAQRAGARRPSGGHDAVRAPRDAPSQHRLHADPPTHAAVGYASLLLGEEHLWTYPVFATVAQCQAEWSAPTQEWILVVQGLGWGIVPCDSDLVLKYSDTMDGMHAKQSNGITGSNVNGISDTHTSQSNDNISVHGFQIVQSEQQQQPGKVNTLLPVFDSYSGLSSVRDMSGAVTYRVKPGDTWHQQQRCGQDRLKRNSDICDMTMYRDPPLLPDTGGGRGEGPDSAEITPATSSRSIRLCGVALGAPLLSSQGSNPFRRHTLPRKARLSSAPPRPPGDSPTPPPPLPAQVSAPSSPKVARPPVAFFPHQHRPQHLQYPTDTGCTDSGATTPTNISPVSGSPSQDSECTTPTETCAYATPPGGSAATTPTEGSAYYTAEEVIIHDANENMINMTNTEYCDLVTNNKQNVSELPEVDKKDSNRINSERTHTIEKVNIPSLCIYKENIAQSNLNALTSEPISPEPPPPELATTATTVALAPTATPVATSAVTTPLVDSTTAALVTEAISTVASTTTPALPLTLTATEPTVTKPESTSSEATSPAATAQTTAFPADTVSSDIVSAVTSITATATTPISPISTVPAGTESTETIPVSTTPHSLVSNDDCVSISEEHITHASPTHLPQPVLESTINTLESETSVAAKCIHESNSNLCPLVTISNVATHKEVAILPAPAITLHSTEDSEAVANVTTSESIGIKGSSNHAVSNGKVGDTSKISVTPSSTTGNLEGIPPRLSRKCSASSLKTTSSDTGKSSEVMRSPTPSDLARRPSFNKAPSPFSAGKSNTLPRTDMSASLTPEASATLLSLYSDKAKSASSLLSSENTSARQLFTAGIVSNKSIDVINDKCSKDNNDFRKERTCVLPVDETSKNSIKAKSASSLVSMENNVSTHIRERSPLEMFAAGTLPNEQHENNMEVDTHNQNSKLKVCSKSNNYIENESNVCNNKTVNNEKDKSKNNDNSIEISSTNMQNMDCISVKQMRSDIAVAHASEHSNSVVPSPGADIGISTSGTPAPLSPAIRCNQDTPDVVVTAQPQEIMVECTNSIEQTNTIATKNNTRNVTQIRPDTNECRETAGDTTVATIAAAAVCIESCGGGTVQNMAAGGSIIVHQAARDQADDKDKVIAASKDGEQLLLIQNSSPGCEEPGPPVADKANTQGTTTNCYLPDSSLQTTEKNHRNKDLVIGEIQSPQGSDDVDIVRQTEVQQLSVDVASSNLVSHVKPEILTDCDIDLKCSQYDCQNESGSTVLDTGIIQLKEATQTQSDTNVTHDIPSESNKMNDAKVIQSHSIAIPNANDGTVNIPHDELFINEDEINIPVKGTSCVISKINNTKISKNSSIDKENVQKSKESDETEKSLNDSLSEGLRAIAKSASFSSKPKGATISNCAALIALTGSAPKPQSHFPMDIICQSKKQHTSRQRLATSLGEPVEPVVVQRRRQSSLGHVDPNQSTEKDSHSERSSSASRIGYRHSTAFGETKSLTPFDLKQTQKSESHAKSNKDVRNISPIPPQLPRPPFVRGKSFDSADTNKKVPELSRSTVKDNELGIKTITLSTKPPIKQIDNKAVSPLPPIRAAKEKDKKNVNKESDDSTKKVLNEKKTEVSSDENLKVQLPLIQRLIDQNVEDLNKEKEFESMSQDLEDLQREKELESMITHSETQISLPQPKDGRVEVSTHIFPCSEIEDTINLSMKPEVSERPACVPSIEILNDSDSIDYSKKISLDSEHIHKNSNKTDHSTTISIPIIIETKVEDFFMQNIESGPSSLDQSQDGEVYEAALEIVETTPAFSSSSTSITTVINVESSSPTSVTPTPAMTPDINQKASTEEYEEHFEDASDGLNENEKEWDKNDFNSTLDSPCEQIIHLGSSQKTLEEPILIMSEEGSVSSGGVVTDPEMLASATASLSSASSWTSNGGPVARRDYPLDEDEEELRWKALLAANDIDDVSENDGCASEDGFEAMDEEMRRLEEKLKIFENELGDSIDPSYPSDNGQTSNTSSRPLFKPEDIEGLRISPLPKVYPPPSMNRTKHFSLMSKMDIEQYGESETESEGNSDNCSDDSADFLYVKKKLKLKSGERRCRSHYLIRPKNMNVLMSNKASFDDGTFENKMDEELKLSGIVSQNDHDDTFDDGIIEKVDILPSQEFCESYEIPSDDPVKLDNIQEECDETESIDQDYEDFDNMSEENIMLYGNEDEPLLGYMWYEDDGMTAVDFDGPEELQKYSGQGALFFIFEDDLDDTDLYEPECVYPEDYNIEEIPQIISETKYIENVKEKEKSPKNKDSERTFVSAFKNSLRKASKYLGPKNDSNQKKRSRSASASRHKHEHNTEDITTKNMHLLPAPDDIPERRRSAALDDYKDYSGVYNVRSRRTRPNYGPMSDSEGPDISCSSGEYHASPALCVNTSDEDPSIAIPPPPTIPPPPLPPVPPPRWSRWEPSIEAPQSAGEEYGCWFEDKQENSQTNAVPAHSTECNPTLDGSEMQFYLVGTPHNVPGNVYEDVQVAVEPESIESEPISIEQIQTGAVYGEPYIKMTGWDPENCCEYEYIDTLPCVDPGGCIQQPLECTADNDEIIYSDTQPSSPSHRPTSLKQLKRKQHEKAHRQEADDGQNYQDYNTTIGVPVKRGRSAQEENSHGRQVSPHPKAIGDRRSWPPRK